MAEKLTFALVSPEQELFHGEVDHVVVPGSEGEFGVLPRHAPFMAVVKQGALRILNDGGERRIFVNGGFADVTPDGLTILAEDAVDLSTVNVAELDQQIAGANDASRPRLEAIRRALG
jgi:F-type H+-transporting ATPase subunit epsilon